MESLMHSLRTIAENTTEISESLKAIKEHLDDTAGSNNA